MVAKKERLPPMIEPREDLVSAAKQAAVGIKERAPETDRQRRLPVENIQDLHEAGLLTLAIPKEFGGTEADLVTQNAVYELIGGASASTAWVMGNHSVLCTRAMGMMGEASHPLIQDVVQNGALISHAAIPGGKTEPAPGGFVASGRWPFVSGSNISTWNFLNTMVQGPPPDWNGSEPPKEHNRWMLLPTAQPGLTIEDTWLAMSVRGSMSNDVLLDQVFVAEDMAPVSNRPAPHDVWLPNGPAALKVPTKARVWMSSMMRGWPRLLWTRPSNSARPAAWPLAATPRAECPATSSRWPTPRCSSSREGPFVARGPGHRRQGPGRPGIRSQ